MDGKSTRRRWLAVVVAATLAASGGTAQAQEAVSGPGKLARAAARAGQRPLRVQAQQAAGPETTPPADQQPFLKTRRGVLVMALMVVGTGYVIYSKFNDRVRSPAS